MDTNVINTNQQDQTVMIEGKPVQLSSILNQINNTQVENTNTVTKVEETKPEEHSIEVPEVKETKPEEHSIEVPEVKETTLSKNDNETQSQLLENEINEFDPSEENLEDDDDEFTDIDNILERDEIVESIRTKVIERLRPNKLDLNSFTVSKNPVKVMNLITNKKEDTDTIDWYLPATGINITMRKFEGTEIVALSGANSGKSVRNTNLDILRLIYDHITNINKPDFETWVKIVAFEDLEQLYFAILIATFKDSNYITYACENNKCKDIDVVAKDYKDMIVFYDDKDRENFFNHIELKSYDYPMKNVEMERIQITNEYCIDIKLPSLYDSLVEPTYLTEKYRTKHQDKLAIISYIGDIYKIDVEQGMLIPIDYTLKTEDNTLIIKNKYRLYMQFLNSLSSDEYSYLTSIINKATEERDICQFVIPEHVCEKCKSTIKPRKTQALRLLFTRHQLAALATI